MPSGIPQVLRYRSAFRRWFWAPELHHRRIGHNERLVHHSERSIALGPMGLPVHQLGHRRASLDRLALLGGAAFFTVAQAPRSDPIFWNAVDGVRPARKRIHELVAHRPGIFLVGGCGPPPLPFFFLLLLPVGA